MAQTLQNQLLIAKSMNGIITFDDGAGTIISDGIITTDDLITDTMTSTNMISENMIVPRKSTPAVNTIFGDTINLTTLCQNLSYDNTTRVFNFAKDNITSVDDFLVAIDTSNNYTVISGKQINFYPDDLYIAAYNTYFTSSVISLTNSPITTDRSITIPRESTTAVNTIFGNINLSTLCQNLYYNTSTRTLSVVNDDATSIGATMIDIDTSNNITVITGKILDVYPDNFYLSSSNTQITSSVISLTNSPITTDRSITIPRLSTPALNAYLGSTINLATLCQNLYFNTTTRSFEIWDDTATGQIFEVDITDNVVWVNTEVFRAKGFTKIRLESPDLQIIDSSLSLTNTPMTSDRNITTTGLLTTNQFLLNPTVLGSTTINWAFGDRTFLILTAGSGTITFNLPPDPTSTYIGTQIHIIVLGSINITFQISTGYFFIDDLNTVVNSKTYSLNTRFFSFTVVDYGVSTWKMTNFQGITKDYADTTFITQSSADARYGRLAVANTWALQNTFSTGILPRRVGGDGTDIQLGGNNQMQYRQATSQYNIGIGANTIVGDTVPAGQVNNTGKRNIGIGDSALQTMDNGVDCIAIGYQAMQNCGSIRQYTVTSNNDIAIGTGAIKNGIYGIDNLVLGHYSMQNNTSGNRNIIIGNFNANGLTNNDCVIIGAGACPSLNDNGILAIGSECMGFATGSANGVTACGVRAAYNNTGGQRGTFYGFNSGYGNTSGNYNNCFGYQAGYSSNPTANYCTAIGAFADYQEDNEFVIGGDNFSGLPERFPRLTLPNKTRLNCCQIIGAVATYNISWRSNENVIINNSATTLINLPAATDSTYIHIGAVFNIIRTDGATSNCIIAANGTETIFNATANPTVATTVAIDSWVQSISFVCVNNVAGSPMWSVCRYNDRVTLATDSRKLQTLTNSTNVNYPMCFTTIATTGYNNVYANSSLTYNPSTSVMTVPNITSTLNGTATNSVNTANVNIADKTGAAGTYYIDFTSNTSGNLGVNADTNLFYLPSAKRLSLENGGVFQSYKTNSTCFQYLTQETLITAATTLINPLRSYYPFTMKTAAAYAITVPVIDASNVGTQLVFKRIGGSLQTLSLTTVSNQPTFLAGNAIGTTTATNVIISATQSCCKLVATQTQNAGAGTFTNTAGSNIITVVTQTSGTLAIGGIINCNGNVRFITAYGTGLGGTGTYTVNALIVAANSTPAAYTSSLTYGWSVISVS